MNPKRESSYRIAVLPKSVLSVILLIALLPFAAPTPASANSVHPDIPATSVQIPYTVEFGDVERGEVVLNYYRYKTCSIDAWAVFDQNLGTPNGDGTFNILRHEYYVSDVVGQLGEPFLLGHYGAYYFNPQEGEFFPLDPDDDRCRPETIQAFKDRMTSGVITLWTTGDITMSADFTSTPSEETPGEIAFTSGVRSNWNPSDVTHTWDFGDGHTGTGLNPVHTYEKPGTYQVKLDVSKDSERDEIVKDVEVLAPELRVNLYVDGQDPETAEVELLPKEERELTLELWTTFGLGKISKINPDLVDLIDLPDGIEIVEAPEFPEDGIELEPVSKHELTWRIKSTADGEGTIQSDWHGEDVNGDAVTGHGSLDYYSPGLVVRLQADPDPLLTGIDVNEDGEIDELDQILTVSATASNLIDEPIANVRSETSGPSPVTFALMDGQLAPAIEGEHDKDFGTIEPGQSVTRNYQFKIAHPLRAEGSIEIVGDRVDGGSFEARGTAKVRVVDGKALAFDIDAEPRPYRSGQLVRFNGTLENLTKITVDGEVLDEGYPIGVMIVPKVSKNAGNGFVVPADYGGETPTEPQTFMLEPGEKIDIRAAVATKSLPEASEAVIQFEIGAWLHDAEEEFPVRLPASRIDKDGPSDEAVTQQIQVPLAADPPVKDPWLTCHKDILGFTDYVSCRFTVGVHAFATGLVGLAKMVGTGLYTIGDAGVRTFVHSIWMLEQTIDALLGDEAAMNRLSEDIAISLGALQQVGSESLRGLAISAAQLGPKIRAALIELRTMLRTGDIKGIAGAVAQFAGENLDMPFEALVKARAALKAMEAGSDLASPAARALQKSIDDQASQLAHRVEDALNTGGVRKLTKEGVLKSGDRLTGIQAAWRAIGLSKTDLDIVLDIARKNNIMLAFRARSARATELINAGHAWPKPGDVALKTVNDIDRIYLDYRAAWDGKVVLVEPPVDWMLKGEARENAINAYLDKFGQLTSPSDFSKDLRNQVRERLVQRMDEYPKGVQSFVKYRDKGIDTNFHIEKQGLPEHMLPNSEAAWDARIIRDDIPAGGSGDPPRRAFVLEMSPAGADDFRAITGDIDFLGIFNLDGSLIEDVLFRSEIYKALRNALGMQHGETFTFSLSPQKREEWLQCCTPGNESVFVANADSHLYASHFRDDLSALEFNPNHQYMAEAGRPFVFMEGMIVEASSEVTLPSPYTGPTWADRMEAVHAAYKKYDPKEIMEKAQDADKHKSEEEFDRLLGRLFRLDGVGGIEEYLKYGSAPVPQSSSLAMAGASQNSLISVIHGVATAVSAASDAANWDGLDEAFSEVEETGEMMSTRGRLGGKWVKVSSAQALDRDGFLHLTPFSYLTQDAAKGQRKLEVFTPGQLRMGASTPFFKVGDRVVVDPGGPHEQESTIAGLSPLTLTDDLDHFMLANTMVALLSPTMLGEQLPSAVMRSRPTITGTPLVGRTLKASAGRWEPKGLAFSYRWLRNGKPIPGSAANRPVYRLVAADRGQRLSVRVTASGQRTSATSATSATTAKIKQAVKLRVKSKTSKKATHVKIKVTAAGVKAKNIKGKLIIKLGRKTIKKVKLKKGQASVKLPGLKNGKRTYKVVYKGNALFAPSTKTHTAKLR